MLCIVLVSYPMLQHTTLRPKRYDWAIYAKCDVPFFAITLIQKTPKVDSVKIMHPEEGSDYNRVWDPDEENEL